MAQVDPPRFDGLQQILAPGHQQPYNGTLFLRHGAKYPLGFHAPQQHRLAGGNQAAKPVHFRAGMVQGRNAEEHVAAGLPMMMLFRHASADEGTVLVQDGLGKAGGTGGKIDGRVVIVRKGHGRRAGRAKRHQPAAILGISRDLPAHEKQHLNAGNPVHDGVHAGYELRPENQHFHISQTQAIGNFIAGIAEVHGHGNAARLEDTKIQG